MCPCGFSATAEFDQQIAEQDLLFIQGQLETKSAGMIKANLYSFYLTFHNLGQNMGQIISAVEILLSDLLLSKYSIL